MVLNDVYFIPGFCRNLISISKLHEQLFGISFYNNGISIKKNGLEICYACMENGLFVLKPCESLSLNAELFKVAYPKSNKKQKLANGDETYLYMQILYYLPNTKHAFELNIQFLPNNMFWILTHFVSLKIKLILKH